MIDVQHSSLRESKTYKNKYVKNFASRTPKVVLYLVIASMGTSLNIRFTGGCVIVRSDRLSPVRSLNICAIKSHHYDFGALFLYRIDVNYTLIYFISLIASSTCETTE